MAHTLRLALTAGAAAATVGFAPATAFATPGDGVAGEVLAAVSVAGHDLVLRTITIAPGGTTGWHYHDGLLYGIVSQGTLTHYASTCEVDGIYDPGGIIVEPSGLGYVHMGRNLGPAPMVLHVLYVNPTGSRLSEDAPAPACA